MDKVIYSSVQFYGLDDLQLELGKAATTLAYGIMVKIFKIFRGNVPEIISSVLQLNIFY